MKRLQVLASCLAFCSLVVFSITACNPASYEIIPGKKEKKSEQSENPQEFGAGSEDPRNPGADEKIPPTSGQNELPTARVETILNGKAVTKIKVGSDVQIQPSYDTVDPDDVGISACRNPGIIGAVYLGAGSAEKSATRENGCESLHISHTFDTAGEYLIEMTVTSNENETARASMTLTVLPADAGDWDRGGFTIAAEPLLTTVGEVVTFTGHCETKTTNAITWAFADQGSGDGRVTTFAFEIEGQFLVEALCADQDGNERHASLTIVVLDRAIDLPGDPTPGTPTPADPDPSGPDADDGSSGEGNDGGQPGQGDPGQGRAERNYPDQGGQGQHDTCYCQL